VNTVQYNRRYRDIVPYIAVKCFMVPMLLREGVYVYWLVLWM